MAICFRETHQGKSIISSNYLKIKYCHFWHLLLWQLSLHARSMNVLSRKIHKRGIPQFFLSYVQVGDCCKQHQTAMVLYKVKPENLYYFWAVMSIIMQVCDNNFNFRNACPYWH